VRSVEISYVVVRFVAVSRSARGWVCYGCLGKSG
jgi:hypothetical protein